MTSVDPAPERQPHDRPAEDDPVVGPYQPWITAYLDLQGWGSRLASWNLQPGQAGSPEWSARAFGTVREFWALRDRVAELIDAFESKPVGQTIRAIHGRGPELTYASYLADRLVLQWFTDCVVLSLPLQPDDEWEQRLAIGLLLTIAALVFVSVLADGATLRGAVAFGWGVEHRSRRAGRELIASSLQQAYLLERSQAEWPRVLIEPSVAKWIRQGDEKQRGSDPAGQALGDLLLREPDNSISLDYLHPLVVRELNHRGPETLARAEAHVRSELRLACQAGSPKLVGRYLRVRQYFRQATARARGAGRHGHPLP